MSDKEIIVKMQLVREICAEGHKERQKLGIPVRQPLASLTIDVDWLEKRYEELCKEYDAKTKN